MTNAKLRQATWRVFICEAIVISQVQSASACSRAVYFGKEGQTVTGRGMDWLEDMQTNLWIFPRGMTQDGGMGDRGFKWTSKCGSVAASSPAYDQQLALNKFWKQIGGTVMPPGTDRAADRFVRASFCMNAVQQSVAPVRLRSPSGLLNVGSH